MSTKQKKKVKPRNVLDSTSWNMPGVDQTVIVSDLFLTYVAKVTTEDSILSIRSGYFPTGCWNLVSIQESRQEHKARTAAL